MSWLFLILGLLAMPCTADDGIRVVSWPTPLVTVFSATVTSISISNSVAVVLLAKRPARIKAIIFNDNNTLYIKAGTGASNADYTWRAPANTEIDVTGYTGPITAILNTAGPGTVHISDF